MLEALDGASLIERLWAATKSQAELPDLQSDFFDLAGPMPLHYESRRAYHRFYFRRQAVLSYDKNLLGVYTTDVSQLGIGFISPVQLFPLDRVTLLIPGPKKTTLQISRCKRLADACYQCGGTFVDAATGAPASDAFPEIADQLVMGRLD